jgi:hypothetical protein
VISAKLTPLRVKTHPSDVEFNDLSRRRGKARDSASPASPASPTRTNRFQQTVCIGDAKCEIARGVRHQFRVLRHQLVPLCRLRSVSGLIRLAGDAAPSLDGGHASLQLGTVTAAADQVPLRPWMEATHLYRLALRSRPRECFFLFPASERRGQADGTTCLQRGV